MLREVQIVKDNPPGKGKSKRKKPAAKRNPKGKGKATVKRAPGTRKNMPKSKPGYYWRKGYSTKNGKRVKGTYVKKRRNPSTKRRAPAKRRNPSPRRAPAKRRSPGGKRKNPKRVAAGRRAAATRRRNAGGKRRAPAKRRNPARRRRRNPENGGTGANYTGEVTVKKTFSQVVLPELVGGTAGVIATAMGPMWIEEQLNLEPGALTEGYRDVATSAAIALGGGLIVGRYIDKRAGKAWAIAGMAVTAVKLIRMITMGEETAMAPGTDGLGATLVRGALLGQNDYAEIYGGTGAGQFSIQGV